MPQGTAARSMAGDQALLISCQACKELLPVATQHAAPACRPEEVHG